MRIILARAKKQNPISTIFIPLYLPLVLLLVWYTSETRGEINGLSAGGRALSMGAAYAGVAEGPEAIFFNPAGLSQSTKPGFSFFVSRLYNLEELTYQNVSAVLPSPYGSLGISLQAFGRTLYRENLLAFGWGNKYGKKIYYGILISRVQIQIQKYGSASVFLFDGGILLKLANSIRCGIAITNLNQAEIGRSKEKISQITRVGISTIPFTGILFSVEIDKDKRFSAQLKGGCEIRFISGFSLRCGFGRKPSYFSAGIGMAWKNFSFDYGFTNHPVLGMTHYGSITLNLGHSKKDLKSIQQPRKNFSVFKTIL